MFPCSSNAKLATGTNGGGDGGDGGGGGSGGTGGGAAGQLTKPLKKDMRAARNAATKLGRISHTSREVCSPLLASLMSHNLGSTVVSQNGQTKKRRRRYTGPSLKISQPHGLGWTWHARTHAEYISSPAW